MFPSISSVNASSSSQRRILTCSHYRTMPFPHRFARSCGVSGRSSFRRTPWTGGCFALGIAISSPLMALGAVVGAVIGSGDGPGAEVRREGADCRDLRLQLHPGRHRHAVLLPAGSDEQFPACRRLRRGDAPDLAGENMFRFRRTPPRSSSQPGSCFSWVRPFRCLRSSLGGRWKEPASSRPWPTESAR